MNREPRAINVRPTSAKLMFGIGGLSAGLAIVVVAFGVWGGPAKANDVYANATGKDCSSCHVNVNRNAYDFTRYGNAFKRNGCPGVRAGCKGRGGRNRDRDRDDGSRRDRDGGGGRWSCHAWAYPFGRGDHPKADGTGSTREGAARKALKECNAWSLLPCRIRSCRNENE